MSPILTYLWQITATGYEVVQGGEGGDNSSRNKRQFKKIRYICTI